MRVERIPVPDVVVIAGRIAEERGEIYEELRTAELEKMVGRRLSSTQVSYPASRRSTLRGICSVTTRSVRAGFVSLVPGTAWGIVVNLRIGFTAFGWLHISLIDRGSARSLFVSERDGHDCLTVTDDTRGCNLISTARTPGTQIDIDPWDPYLTHPCSNIEYVLISRKDRTAYSAAQAAAAEMFATRGNRSAQCSTYLR